MALQCARCGRTLEERARFCSNCGLAAEKLGSSRLFRPKAGRKIAGVCQGFAIRYGWDPVVVRLVAVLLLFLLIPIGILAYLVLWLIMPEEQLALTAGMPLNPVNPV